MLLVSNHRSKFDNFVQCAVLKKTQIAYISGKQKYAIPFCKFEEADLPTAEKLRNDPRYIHLYDRQGIGIYLDMSSVKVNVCNPPIYDISGIYYHIRFGEQVACSKRMNRIKKVES